MKWIAIGQVVDLLMICSSIQVVTDQLVRKQYILYADYYLITRSHIGNSDIYSHMEKSKNILELKKI